MNRIDVSGPPWLIDVAEQNDPETMVSDLFQAMNEVATSHPGAETDVVIVLRAVDDRCDDALRSLHLEPDHDRWVQVIVGPASRNDFPVRQAFPTDLHAIAEVCARSRHWGEHLGAEPDAANIKAAITDRRVWVHERNGRLVCALVLAVHDESGLRTIERLAALSAPDDRYTGPKEDLDRSLALQTLKATLWALLPETGGQDTATTTGMTASGLTEVQVSVASDDFEGVNLFEAAKLRYRHTDRFYRLVPPGSPGDKSDPFEHP